MKNQFRIFWGVLGVVSIFLFSTLPPSSARMEEMMEASSPKMPALKEATGHSGYEAGEALSDREIASVINELKDHIGKVFDFQGDARLLRKDAERWKAVQRGMIIRQGDQIVTGKNSFVEIAFDSYFLNIARIEEKTRAEFLSIEPTNIRLEDGTVFSSLEGLKPGQGYKVTTPTAVAAVRGTVYSVSYSRKTEEAEIKVFEDHNGRKSIVEVSPTFLQRDVSPGENPSKIALREGYKVALSPTSHTPPEPIPQDEAYAALEKLQGFSSAASAARDFGKNSSPSEMENQAEDPEDQTSGQEDHTYFSGGPPDGGSGGDSGAGPDGGSTGTDGNFRISRDDFSTQEDGDKVVDSALMDWLNATDLQLLWILMQANGSADPGAPVPSDPSVAQYGVQDPSAPQNGLSWPAGGDSTLTYDVSAGSGSYDPSPQTYLPPDYPDTVFYGSNFLPILVPTIPMQEVSVQPAAPADNSPAPPPQDTTITQPADSDPVPPPAEDSGSTIAAAPDPPMTAPDPDASTAAPTPDPPPA